MAISLVSLVSLGAISHYFYNTGKLMTIFIDGMRMHSDRYNLSIQDFFLYLNTNDQKYLDDCIQELDKNNAMPYIFGQIEKHAKENNSEELADIVIGVLDGSLHTKSNAKLLVSRLRILLPLKIPEFQKVIKSTWHGYLCGVNVKKEIENYHANPNPEIFEKLNIAMQEMNSYYTTYAESIHDVQSLTNKVLKGGFFIIVVMFCVIVFFTLLSISRAITEPMSELVTNMNAVAIGDLSGEIHIDTSDELGQLTASFNRMKLDMQQTIDHAHQIADGDYSNVIAPKSGKDELSITLNKMTRSLEAARQDIENKAKQLGLASKYKSEFLANMSHELRTPLNSILILAQDLADNNMANLEEMQVDAAKIIHKCGNDLLNLINEILDLSKIEAGKVSLYIEKILLTDIAQNIKWNFHHQIENKKLKLVIKVAANLPKYFQTDQQRLEQIIKNLLSNAIKFTNDGSITVNFHRPGSKINFSNPTLKRKSTVAISVKDTGIGIPVEKQTAIFEAFQQADGSTSRRYGGTGLGLSISLELVKLLGGELQIHSKEDAGSTFTIFIPRVFDNKNTEVEIQESSNELNENKEYEITSRTSEKKKINVIPVIEDDGEKLESLYIKDSNKISIAEDEKDRQKNISTLDDKNGFLKDKNILLVDDDVRNIFAVSKILEDREANIFSAVNGEKALEILKEKPEIDMVLMDIMMPVLDGYETMKQLRAQQQFSNLPIIALTAKAMVEDRKKCIDAGANDYISKPLDISKLLSLMKSWLYN